MNRICSQEWEIYLEERNRKEKERDLAGVEGDELEDEIEEEMAVQELEKLLTLDEEELDTATWKLMQPGNEWTSVVHRMQDNWKQLRKQRKRALKGQSNRNFAEGFLMDDISSCRLSKNKPTDKICGTSHLCKATTFALSIWFCDRGL